ncbi:MULTISPECIES: ABC transporter permease [Pseudoxanthomonas]|jgi:ABC-2 type transport system permease protein|uniref:ABC transporter permease n=1 Tax=Pseudoxanthomonas winnipegensis TaxID=2480810 RepID=A0A4Q8LJ15_9GAMM|nr:MULTISPECIES: ABC transporter permease [Pseudoxanthomonas]MDQ1118805.1 ABC-2 type transport system permease protein [Pseudoxanthomonas winnipegensis]MDQ1131995.1 ABC-2 type transport system permease protein [Pseudoxanthomonas winnipegensis]MDR6137993.1 ABC-2 type transport system permease protein [Pseudoxanthomonas sp. SORGH_AS_0997]RZZ86943.1 ABC transporter permease [Pseudoxanthomonas winnipegensis]RZZ87540.1 ABC transporter permease [Pseudoxanthomonas winnipegensis]
MNAPARTLTKPGVFAWLLRREYWENRGGFLWAQVITGGIVLFFAALGAVIGAIQMRSHMGGDTVGSDFSKLATGYGIAGDIALLSGFAIASVVVAFVVFFYCLGSLYNDRHDRSVLFWKSLPVSDTMTVASKLTWALLLTQVVSLVVGLLVGLGLWVIIAVASSAAGLPGAGAIFTASHPFRIIGSVLATLPIYMLWSLPAIGWLMLCSAWARRVPFLWAVLVPLLLCLVVSIMAAMPGVRLPLGPVWYTVMYRGLLSVIPGMWQPARMAHNETAESALNAAGDPTDSLRMGLHNLTDPSIYASADLWIGAAVGIALIALAVVIRRRRDDA